MLACGSNNVSTNHPETAEYGTNNAFTNHAHLQFLYGEWEYEGDNPQSYVKDNNDSESSNSKTVALVPDIDAINMTRIQGTLYITKE